MFGFLCGRQTEREPKFKRLDNHISSLAEVVRKTLKANDSQLRSPPIVQELLKTLLMVWLPMVAVRLCLNTGSQR